MSNTEKELKAWPCPTPWCNGSKKSVGLVHHSYDHTLQAGTSWAVECGECGVSGPVKNTEAEAIAAWNTRPASPLAEENKRLRDHIRWIEECVSEERTLDAFELCEEALAETVAHQKEATDGKA